MRFWWLTDYARVGAEKAAIELLSSQEPWFRLTSWMISEYRLAALGDIVAHEIAYPVRLIYPDAFPSVPAWVEPQDVNAKWTKHQFGEGGTLCLELRPDTWSPLATGADVLRSAYNLLSLENPLGQGEKCVAPSAHRIGETQAYDWGANPVLIGAGCLERIKSGPAIGVRGLRWMAADKIWPIYISDAQDLLKPLRPPSVDIATWRFAIPVAIVVAEPPAAAPADRESLIAAVAPHTATNNWLPAGDCVVIVTGTSETVVYHVPEGNDVFRRQWVVIPDQMGQRSGRAFAAGSKSVAIVGAGSVGSKLAECLLRSGMSRQLLVDGDVFLPGNLERHVLDWRDVGYRKVHGLQRRLLHIAPGAEIVVIDQNLNWQRSAKTHADQIEAIAACDIIIDCTADAATQLLLGALAADYDRTFVSVEVLGGGIGAVIGRAVPDLDPAYVHGRVPYRAWCEEQNKPLPVLAQRTYETLTEDGEPVVADDAATTIAAGHAARVVLDCADGRPERGGGWLLIGLSAAWVFSGHGHVIRLDVGAAVKREAATEDRAARDFVHQLAEEALRAAQPSS